MTAYRDYLCDPILTSWTKISETKNKWLFIRLHIYLMYWRVCWWPVEVWWFKRLDSWIGCFHEKCWQGTFESMQKIILYFLNNVLRIHRVVPFIFFAFPVYANWILSNGSVKSCPSFTQFRTFFEFVEERNLWFAPRLDTKRYSIMIETLLRRLTVLES